jgi:methionyl-tRNA formyltransferase
MKIVYAGNNQRGIACLEVLAHSDRHNVVYAMAQKGESGWYSSIGQIADELSVPNSIIENPNSPEFLEKLRGLSPELVVMCGYSKIVGADFRKIPKYGCINLHASALPFYRGAAPLNWALINGEREIGLSIYQVDKGIDTGPILAQTKFEVGFRDTIRDVSERVLEIYPEMLLRVCDDIELGRANPQPQDLNSGSYFTKRRSEDGRIIWNLMEDVQIHNLVRALSPPYPCAFFYRGSGGQKIKVLEADVERKEYRGISGRVAVKDDEGIVVIAKNRGVRLKRMETIDGKEANLGGLKFRAGEDLA